MVSQSLVIAYHGCDLRVARKVISLKTNLRLSRNDWDWLGHGIYFWEDSYARAERWAREESTRKGSKIKTPAVVCAVIDLGNCLNLADSESLDEVRVAHKTYLQICAAADAPVARNRGVGLRARYLDCAVMETLHQLHAEEGNEPFDTARGFFMEGRELYSEAGFRELDHIQICVRNPKRILGCFWRR